MDNISETGEEMYKYIDQYFDFDSDTIAMAHHSRIMCNRLNKETGGDNILIRKILDILNDHAIHSSTFAVKFAILMSSNQWRNTGNDTYKTLRSNMINILQTNYTNREELKKVDYEHLYNAITIHGEYFHRFRLTSGLPISILGLHCLGWMTEELTKQMKQHQLLPSFVKLVFAQIVLNGSLFEQNCHAEIEKLLLVIRKCLINLDGADVVTRTYLLMSLDVFYCKFGQIDANVQQMYMSFILKEQKAAKKNEAVTPSTSEESKVGHETSPPEKENVETELPPVESRPVELNTAVKTLETLSLEALEANRPPTSPLIVTVNLKSIEEIQKSLNTKRYKLYKKKKSPPLNGEHGSSSPNDSSSSDQNYSKNDDMSSSDKPSTDTTEWEIVNPGKADQNCDSDCNTTALTAEEANSFNKNRFQRGKKIQPMATNLNPKPRFIKKKKNTNNHLQTNGTHDVGSSDRSISPMSRAKNGIRNYNVTNYLQPASIQQSENQTSEVAEMSDSSCPKPAYFREENVENLTWDPVNCSEWDNDTISPDKNSYTKKFLSFLQQNN